MQELVVGPWRIDHIEEMRGPVRPPGIMFDAWRPELQDAHDWLAPLHLDPATGFYVASIGGWLLRGHGRTILLDTGAGVGKPRPSHPRYHMRHTGGLDALARLGVAPGVVDTVVLSHAHVDHVGGTTVAGPGGWYPAFPAARYVIGGVELEDASVRASSPDAPDDRAMIFSDSIAPLKLAGLLDAVALPAAIAPGLTLEAAPGHTLGHAMLRLTAAGAEAVFLFDVAHSALQLLEPDWNTSFCEHPELARQTRHRVLDEAARSGALVFCTHFAHAGPCVLRARGNGFLPLFQPAIMGATA